MNTQLEELACLYVLDKLDPRQRMAFERQLVEQPELAGFVRELEAALSARVRALPAAVPSPAVWDRVEAEIATSVPTGAAKFVAPSAATRFSARAWAFLGAAAALVAVGFGFVLARQVGRAGAPNVIVVTLGNERSAATQMPIAGHAGSADARFVQLATLAQQYWERPDLLPGGAAQPTREGYALFDPATRQGFIAVRQLPALPGDQRYHLWIVDRKAGSVRDAGAIPAETAGQGMFFFSVEDAAARSEAVNFFVTVESTDQVAATPKGRVVLGRDPF